jgi:short-subunit dehydrogenase
MRRPEDADDLQRIVDIECMRLDVTDPDSIREAIDKTLDTFGRIDVVVNNAGYAVAGPFEAATDEQIERLFQTNVFGVMEVCRAVIPYFREQKRGQIVNVASIGGRITFPLYSLYHATKWAIEGFSESLHYELAPFNIKIKLIEPGPIKTDFYTRSQVIAKSEGLTAYENLAVRAMANMQLAGEHAPDGSIVAQAIYDAVTDGSDRLRYGVNTRGLLAARRLLPERLFYYMIRKIILK